MDRGLVANQVHMTRLPWNEPLRLRLVTRVEVEEVLGSRARPAAPRPSSSAIFPSCPSSLLSPRACCCFHLSQAGASSWKGEDASGRHTMCFHPEGAETGTHSGLDILPSPATITLSHYGPLPIQPARFGGWERQHEWGNR